jgi:predicted tellurium resistance membrane protein TerC
MATDFLLDPNVWATFALLIGLELVLGIDNVLMISIMTAGLPHHQRPAAVKTGLALAFVLRIAALLGVSALLALKTPVIGGLSWKDIILAAGGLFLVYKAATEIHHSVEHPIDDEAHGPARKLSSFGAAIGQIALLDLVFSIDSVITAVGLTPHLIVIVAAVIVSFTIVLFFAQRVGDFIHRHPALKVLCLSFLLVIGVTLILEGFHQHIPKAYLYAPMGFALVVELIQMRQAARIRKLKGEPNT